MMCAWNRCPWQERKRISADSSTVLRRMKWISNHCLPVWSWWKCGCRATDLRVRISCRFSAGRFCIRCFRRWHRVTRRGFQVIVVIQCQCRFPVERHRQLFIGSKPNVRFSAPASVSYCLKLSSNFNSVYKPNLATSSFLFFCVQKTRSCYQQGCQYKFVHGWMLFVFVFISIDIFLWLY